MLWKISATRFEALPPRLCWLACGVATSGDFGVGLLELVFDFVGQLEPVFKIIIDPLANLLDFVARQVRDCRLDFFDGAHANNLAQSSPMRREKRGFGA